jgi:hypothetical protein
VETYDGRFGGGSGGDGVGGVGALHVVRRLPWICWEKKGGDIILIDGTCFQLYSFISMIAHVWRTHL